MDERDPAQQRQPPGMTTQQTGTTPPPAPNPAIVAAIEPELQAHIGRMLRAVYDEVVSEEVPDRFVKLLEQLERKPPGSR